MKVPKRDRRTEGERIETGDGPVRPDLLSSPGKKAKNRSDVMTLS